MISGHPRWILPVVFLLAAGCADFEESSPTPWISADVTPDTHTGAELELPQLEAPTARCDHELLSDEMPTDTPSADSQVTLTELIGAEGCPYERTRHAYEDGRETLFFKEYLDPDPMRYPYVDPVDHSLRRVYGDSGELLEEHRSPSPGEPTEDLTEFAYDHQGRTLLERRSTRQDSGALEEVERKVWEYAADPPTTHFSRYVDDNLVSGREEQFSPSGELLSRHVVEADGTRWLAEEWERDDADRPLARRVWAPSGRLLTEFAWTHNADGTSEKTRTRHDMGWEDVWRYDTEGNEVYHSQDSDGDGDLDYIDERSYVGEQMVFHRVRYDFGADGRALTEHESTWTLDERGRVVEMTGHSFHEPRVNAAPKRETRTIEHLDDGSELIEHETRHLETDELLTARYTRTDAFGEVVWRRDINNYLDRDEVVAWMRTYDDDGRPLLIAADSDGDGVADSVIRHEYDAFGNLLEKNTDSDADGLPEERVVNRYGTPSL
jgi:hypothetical protein